MPDPTPPTPSDDPYRSPSAKSQRGGPVGFRDLKGLIVLMGILAIIGGLGLGCMGGFYGLALPLLMEQVPEEERGGAALEAGWMRPMMASMGVVLLGMAAALIWLGIGAVRLRRWAGDLFLAGGWLYGGVMAVSMASMLWVLPQMLTGFTEQVEQTSPSGADAENVTQIVFVGTLIGMALFYLVPPAVVILVFGMKSARKTLRHYDHGTSWTDGIPIPVLVWWVLFVSAAGGCLIVAPGMGPFYATIGMVREGWQAVVLLLGISGISAAGAWAIARKKPWSWYVCLAFSLLGLAGGFMMAENMDIVQMYREMGMTEEELAPLEAMYGSGEATTYPMLLTVGALLVYALVTKRWFQFDREVGTEA